MKSSIIEKRAAILKILAVMMAMALSYVAGTVTPLAWTQSNQSNLQYIQVDFKKVPPGKLQSYLEVEQTWKPVHRELISTGNKRAWAVYGVAFAGANDEYNYLTLNIFDKFEQMENQYPPDVFQKVYPGRDLSEIDQKTIEASTNVRSDVWILIDEVGLAAASGEMTRK